MKRYLLASLLVLLILSVSAWTQVSKPQYEYKFEYSIKEKRANELAAQGWELIAVGTEGTTINVAVFVFRRSK